MCMCVSYGVVICLSLCVIVNIYLSGKCLICAVTRQRLWFVVFCYWCCAKMCLHKPVKNVDFMFVCVVRGPSPRQNEIRYVIRTSVGHIWLLLFFNIIQLKLNIFLHIMRIRQETQITQREHLPAVQRLGSCFVSCDHSQGKYIIYILRSFRLLTFVRLRGLRMLEFWNSIHTYIL